MKTTTTSALRVVYMILLVGCADELGPKMDEADDEVSRDDAAAAGDGEPLAPTSVIDPATGDQVAINFPRDAEFTYVESINKELETLAYVDEPRNVGNVEINLVADKHFALTGVGARVASSAVTTLWIKQQLIGPNGELGLTKNRKTGADVPEPEAWCEADAGYLIVGVGGRISNGNMVSMILRTYRYDALSRELIGDPKHVYCGSQAGGAIEQWVYLNDYALPHPWWQLAATGIGFRELNDNLDRVRLHYGHPN